MIPPPSHLMFGKGALQVLPGTVPHEVMTRTQAVYSKVVSPFLEQVDDNVLIEVHPNCITRRHSLKTLLQAGDLDLLGLFKLKQSELLTLLKEKSLKLNQLLEKVRYNDLMLLVKRTPYQFAQMAKMSPEALREHFVGNRRNPDAATADNMIFSDYLRFITGEDLSQLLARNEEDHIGMRDMAFIYRKDTPPPYEAPKNFKGTAFPPARDVEYRKHRWKLVELIQDPDESQVDFARHVAAQAIASFPGGENRFAQHYVEEGGKIRVKPPDDPKDTSSPHAPASMPIPTIPVQQAG